MRVDCIFVGQTAEDYLERILPIFETDRTHEVSVAAGKVLTRYDRAWTERARMMEYLFNFHSLRPLQQATGFRPHDLLKVLRMQQSFKQHYLDLYADQSHYIHAFRKITGYTPAKYVRKFGV